MSNIIATDFYVYQENFSALAAGISATGNINIQADSDFELQKLTMAANISGAAQTDSSRVVPLVNVLIVDNGSGRNLFEEAVPVAALFGNGELPFILPTPKLFRARSAISVTVTNVSAATTYNLGLSFIGKKVFRAG